MRRTMLVVAFLMAGCAEEGAPFETSGTVHRVEGASPLHEGDSCTVGIANESRGGYPCRVSVSCGAHTLYGGSQLGGYARCSARDGRWLRASDDMLAAEDGDPWMDFDVRAGTVVVRSAAAETEIAIDRSSAPLAAR